MTFLTHPNQKRLACERCRRQKLRCSRLDADEARCSRCARLGFSCVAGQQRRIGRPSRGKPKETPASNNDSDDPMNTSTDKQIQTETPDSLFNDFTITEESSAATSQATAAMLGDEVDDDALLGDFSWGETALDFDAVENITESPGANIAQRLVISPDIQHKAMVKLSKINVELHSHMSKVNLHRDSLDLCSFICAKPILSVANVTVAELALILFQDFVRVVSSLGKEIRSSEDLLTLKNNRTLPPLSWDACSEVPATFDLIMLPDDNPLQLPVAHSARPIATEVVDAPLALVITSCYIQIIQLFEVICLHIHRRLESLAEDPLMPIEGLKFGAFSIGDGNLQGVIFTQIITSLLDTSERLLGLSTTTHHTLSHAAVMSAQQGAILRDQLRPAGLGYVMRSEKLRGDIEYMRRCLTEASGVAV
ncbi:uncharacterized protein CTRU02_203037 [Colletotrichum truncatum]|uniref:Uncharacterized protein n=1 Tax=Colletotrichum truncatum TaxID=5467 RepID=A0ACC3Z841_COLTU|nr:uncharacterized protein CTRU02_13142 [Colletotrichum truncatum]KAF6783634.1 hypothetical protein CTRU02_13142 [Colletotrichum truncatum]